MIQDLIARNPNFAFLTPRIFTAYAEAIFPFRFFVDGRHRSRILPELDGSQRFYRRNRTFGFANISPDLDALSQAHPIRPGQSNGTGNYVVSTTDQGLKADVRIVQFV